MQKNIKEYYKAELEHEANNELSADLPKALSRPSSSRKDMPSVKLDVNVKKTSKNDYRLTKTDIDKIEPGPIKPRAQYKLREVCQANNYILSLKDFEEEKILIGEGKFGEVYLVYCTLNDCKYALKILDKEIVQDCGYERHILREKEITSMLDHPNIVRLESYFHDSDYCYFLFELCRVGDLHTFIRTHGKLTVNLTRDYAMEIIQALEYLREHNIVHRDLKPKNILIDDSFHVKIADFGAAKVINPEEVQKEIDELQLKQDNSSDDDSSDFSDTENSFDQSDYSQDFGKVKNTCIGTPLYISPEMMESNIGCFASDLWALGCIIYECLAGSSPFTGRNKFEIEDHILCGEFDFPKGFDKEAKDLIRKLLKVNPNERLGAGAKGSSIDMKALKAHPFFEGKDFTKSNRNVPAVASLKENFDLARYTQQYKNFRSNKENFLEREDSESSVQSMDFKSISTTTNESKTEYFKTK